MTSIVVYECLHDRARHTTHRNKSPVSGEPHGPRPRRGDAQRNDNNTAAAGERHLLRLAEKRPFSGRRH